METNIINAFTLAAQSKLRFNSSRGQLTVEDLFDLSLVSLDALAVAVDEELRPQTKSFLENPNNKANRLASENALRLEILKAVIGTKQEDNKASAAAVAKRQQREFLTGLRDKRKINDLENLTTEEIEAQLAALDAQ